MLDIHDRRHSQTGAAYAAPEERALEQHDGSGERARLREVTGP